MFLPFDDTSIAFAWRSDAELKKAYWLFRVMSKVAAVSFGNFLLNVAIKIHFPIAWLVKPTIFKHFVGGESLNECIPLVKKMGEFNVCSILDYSVEGSNSEKSYQSTFDEIVRSIKKASEHSEITFAVFKPTGLIDVGILEKISTRIKLTDYELKQFDNFSARIDQLCDLASSLNTPILIDAEDTWYQQAIDDVAAKMMSKYNTSKAIVYNTLQMYRAVSYTHLTLPKKRIV